MRTEISPGLLDVNALVALAWDSHVHHVAARTWFESMSPRGWATCPITENGFVRVSSNPKVLPAPISVAAALEVLAAMRHAAGHRFLSDDVSPVDADFPRVAGHKQITDAAILTVARRHRAIVITFDRALAALGAADAELLHL